MPPRTVLPTEVYVISSFIWDDDDKIEGLQPTEAYTTMHAAEVAAKEMLIRHCETCDDDPDDFSDWEFIHNYTKDGFYRGELRGVSSGMTTAVVHVTKTNLKAGAAPTTGAGGRKKAIKSEPEDEGEEGVENEHEDDVKDEDEDAIVEVKAKKPVKKGPPKTAITNNHRKTIPQGEPNCLAGLKLLFTGTFETMDRKTSVATAYKYGAEVITKLEDTDYIVIGTRAGPAKLKKINELELETISEEEFFQILENGVPQEKKDRMENRRLADREGPEDDDDEEEEEDVKPKKRAAPKKTTAPAKKRAKK